MTAGGRNDDERFAGWENLPDISDEERRAMAENMTLEDADNVMLASLDGKWDVLRMVLAGPALCNQEYTAYRNAMNDLLAEIQQFFIWRDGKITAQRRARDMATR